MNSETKIEDSFPESNFLVNGFSDPFRIDRNIHEGVILFYVRKNIPAKLLLIEPIPSEGFFVELNMGKWKWLIFCSYNLHKKYVQTYWDVKKEYQFIFSSR